MSINLVVIGPNRVVAIGDSRTRHHGATPIIIDGGPPKVFPAGRYSVAGCLGATHAAPGESLKERLRRLASDPAFADSPKALMEAFRDEITGEMFEHFSNEWIRRQATLHFSAFCVRRKPSGEIDLYELRFPLADRQLCDPEIVQHIAGIPDFPPTNRLCYCRPPNPIAQLVFRIPIERGDMEILDGVDFVFSQMNDQGGDFRQAVGGRIDIAAIDADGFRWLRSADVAEFAEVGADVIDWGGDSALNQTGDMSFGIWINLPSNAAGTIAMRGLNSSSAFDANDCFKLGVASADVPFSITYSHDYGSGGTLYDSNDFDTQIPAGRWAYVGITRNAAAKTVKMYVGYGDSVTLIDTWTYPHSPEGGGDASCRMLIGNVNGSAGGIFWNGPFTGTVQEHYYWKRQLSQAEHEAAMKGNPSMTGLVLGSYMGDTPEVDFSSTGAEGAVTGTTLVQGHN